MFCVFILGVLISLRHCDPEHSNSLRYVLIRLSFLRHFVRLCPSALQVYRQLCRNEAEMAADLRLMEDHPCVQSGLSGHNRKQVTQYVYSNRLALRILIIVFFE